MSRKRLYQLKKELLTELYRDAIKNGATDADMLRLGILLGETDKQITHVIEYFQQPGDASQVAMYFEKYFKKSADGHFDLSSKK